MSAALRAIANGSRQNNFPFLPLDLRQIRLSRRSRESGMHEWEVVLTQPLMMHHCTTVNCFENNPCQGKVFHSYDSIPTTIRCVILFLASNTIEIAEIIEITEILRTKNT